jgi:methylase of polypeptide subunit release factors
LQAHAVRCKHFRLLIGDLQMEVPLLSPEDAALVALVQMLRNEGYQFTTVTPLTQARVNKRPGNEWASDLAGVFGWSRRFQPSLLPARLFNLMGAAGVLHREEVGYRARIRVSSHGGQHFVHSAYPTLDENSVFFGPDTVRFVGAISRVLGSVRKPSMRVADIGCGAGPGAIFIATATPDAEVMMLDINPLALRYARVNAASNGVAALAVHSDVLSDVDGSFELIVSNPPYLIDSKARAYRHGGGHSGEGLSLEILRQSMSRLSPGGTLLLYTGSSIVGGLDRFLGAARDLLEGSKFDWSYHEIDPDVFGEELELPAYATADRIAAVVLTVTAAPRNETVHLPVKVRHTR